MNPEKHHDAAWLAERLQQLSNERRRLEDLRQAYRTIERSKFSRARELWTDLLALAGVIGKESFIPTVANGAHASLDAGRARDQVLNLQAENTGLLDVIIAERTRTVKEDPYNLWRRKHAPDEDDYRHMRETLPLLTRRPTISIVMATYNTPERYLRAAIDSVREQIYPHWQLCIADDASTNAAVRPILGEYAAIDERIDVVYRPQNGHISQATNSALDIATGDFVGFLDHDDVLPMEALYEVASLVERNPDADIMYSDEDKLDESGGLFDPFFKPDWSPDTLLSRMYTCHFAVYRRRLVEEVGRLRPQFDGSQDYDLILRLSERTDRIHHIPKILYHWRVHPESTAAASSAKPYAADAAERAIEEALARRGEPGSATARTDVAGAYVVRYELRERKQVSIIIPTRDHGEDVDRCLESIFKHGSYENFEVLLVDNGSTDPSSLATFERWAARDARVRVLRYDVPFNFSQINNYAVSRSSGEYLLFLNNDTEVMTPDWLEAMVEQAQRPSIGAVGAMLLYPDMTIQHAGVVVGVGGVAGHSHKNLPADAPGYFHMLKAINNYSAVTGACLMVRRAAFDQVGGFDEELAVAFNDVDLCLKLQAAKYRNVCLPHVQLIHFESKSRGYEDSYNKQVRFEDEKRLMIQRWHTNAHVDPCYNPNLTREAENFALRT